MSANPLNSIENYEFEMNQLEADKNYTFSIYEKIKNLMDSCLIAKDYVPLFELLPYFEDLDSYPHFHHSSDTRRVHIILNVLKLELQYKKACFLSSTKDYSDFLEQYIQTVFALRRLELSLSPEAMEEAAQYLNTVSLSIYAAKIITENEYFENFETLYWNLYHIMDSFWSATDKILWLQFLLEKAPDSNVLLELASLYMDMGNYREAYKHLTDIPNPSYEITQLIATLKEFLHNE